MRTAQNVICKLFRRANSNTDYSVKWLEDHRGHPMEFELRRLVARFSLKGTAPNCWSVYVEFVADWGYLWGISQSTSVSCANCCTVINHQIIEVVLCRNSENRWITNVKYRQQGDLISLLGFFAKMRHVGKKNIIRLSAIREWRVSRKLTIVGAAGIRNLYLSNMSAAFPFDPPSFIKFTALKLSP
jgi:hypothetical protein